MFCAKELIENGSTLVSYLLVEPLVYYEEGVGRVSVYRKTISPYDRRYAWITLERFKSILESKKTEDIKLYSYKKETKNIKINEVLLKKLFNENGMVCPKWNSQV